MSIVKVIKNHIDENGELKLNKSMTDVMIEFIELLEKEVIYLKRELIWEKTNGKAKTESEREIGSDSSESESIVLATDTRGD